MGRAQPRRLAGATLAALAAAAFAAGPAEAIPALREKLTTPHFVVHYTTASGSPDAISADSARVLGENAEAALAAEQGPFGFDPPLSGADGHIDIYVYEFTDSDAEGRVGALTPDDQSEAQMEVRSALATDLAVVAHEMFHVLQLSVWRGAGLFINEATAVWAQVRAFPDVGHTVDFGENIPLDCIADDTVCPNAGYQSWSFFEYLAERFGVGVVREVFDQARTLRVNRPDGTLTPITAVAATLTAHGSSLKAAFRGFALANLTGDYTLDELAAGGVLTTIKPLRTGTKTAMLPVRAFTIDHLATNYLPVASGGRTSGSKCRKATLRLRLSGPANALAGYAVADGRARAIAFAGGTGRLTIRSWSTCRGKSLTLALINGDTVKDRGRFRVVAGIRVA